MTLLDANVEGLRASFGAARKVAREDATKLVGAGHLTWACSILHVLVAGLPTHV